MYVPSMRHVTLWQCLVKICPSAYLSSRLLWRSIFSCFIVGISNGIKRLSFLSRTILAVLCWFRASARKSRLDLRPLWADLASLVIIPPSCPFSAVGFRLLQFELLRWSSQMKIDDCWRWSKNLDTKYINETDKGSTGERLLTSLCVRCGNLLPLRQYLWQIKKLKYWSLIYFILFLSRSLLYFKVYSVTC